MQWEISTNPKLGGIEIRFPDADKEKPPKELTAGLKALGFIYHGRKRLWYAPNTLDRWDKVKALLTEAAK